MHNVSVGFRDSVSAFTDSRMAILMSRANSLDDDLSEPELVQLYAGIQKIFRVWEEAYFLHKRGRLDEDIWDSMMRQYSFAIGTKAFRRVWDNRKDMFSSEFQQFVDSTAPKGQMVYR